MVTSIILFILAGACAIWQISLVAIASALIRSGRYKNVRIGIVPGILAPVFAIIGVILL